MSNLRTIMSVIAFLVAAVYYLCPEWICSNPNVIYVSPSGSNWNSGDSPRSALISIQKAVDKAKPGTVIKLLPGVYYQRVRLLHGGSRKNPITIEAVEPGTVILTGAAPPRTHEEWAWRNEENGIFSTIPPWSIYEIKESGATLFDCYDLLVLKSYTKGLNAFNSFTYQGDRLYVWLTGGRDPRSVDLQFNGPSSTQRANGIWLAANLWFEAGHFRIRGLIFDFPGLAGACIYQGGGFTFEDCLFQGGRAGVSNSIFGERVDNIQLVNCAYFNHPELSWRQTAWLTKKMCYGRPSLNSGLLAGAYNHLLVRNNLVCQASDGVHASGRNNGKKTQVEVVENFFAYCTDDVVEFDGAAVNVRFYKNLIYDSHESLGVSPVLVGPTEISHNLFLHPSDGINGAQVKLLNPWQAPNSPIKNVIIHHNTFIGNWLCWWSEDIPVIDVVVSSNIFVIKNKTTPPWPNGVRDNNNLYLDIPESGIPDPLAEKKWFQGLQLETNDGYVGATPPGEVWRIPRPGPRWLDWENHPASKGLEAKLSKTAFESYVQ
jgi:hypothetical protein